MRIIINNTCSINPGMILWKIVPGQKKYIWSYAFWCTAQKVVFYFQLTTFVLHEYTYVLYNYTFVLHALPCPLSTGQLLEVADRQRNFLKQINYITTNQGQNDLKLLPMLQAQRSEWETRGERLIKEMPCIYKETKPYRVFIKYCFLSSKWCDFSKLCLSDRIYL